MWLEERGTSGDISETVVGCDCGIVPRPLYDALGFETPDHGDAGRRLLRMTPPLPEIRRLGVRALEELARALRDGEIAGGSSPFHIRRIVPTLHEAAALELARLLEGGLPTQQLAFILEVVVAEWAAKDGGHGTELVTSGPETTGTSRDTGVVMRELFAGAVRRVLVVGFAVHQGRQVFRALAERMDQHLALHVRLCLDVARRPGDTLKATGILERFANRFRKQEWPGARLPEVCQGVHLASRLAPDHLRPAGEQEGAGCLSCATGRMS